jgi:Flp pilus assembly protein TadG
LAVSADSQIVAVLKARASQSSIGQLRTRQEEGGFVLIVTSIAVTLLLGLAGLGIDIGRMYVIRAELQSFTDAAALSAALQLNGTESSLDRARAGAARLAEGPHAMRWDLGAQPITNISTSFSSDGKTWLEQPTQARDYRLVRVVASEPAPVIFLRIFQPLTSTIVSSASVAAKADQTVRLVQ